MISLCMKGRLKSSQAVGALVSLWFADGKQFEVSKAPSKLVPGDVVRIYKVENGYEAHLWKASEDTTLPSDATPVGHK